jgi:ABC-type transporter MlaC component
MRPRLIGSLVVAALTLLSASLHAQPAGDAAAAAELVLRQLDAFRRNDYDTAYTFASAEIHRLFDRQAFEDMVKRGYPEIADSVRARVASTRTAPNGNVHLVIKIRGANGQQIEALYEMVHEEGAWKINGVAAQPDPGEEA